MSDITAPAPPGNPNPTIDTARMPNVPQGTPPEMADPYQEQMDAMPQDQSTAGF